MRAIIRVKRLEEMLVASCRYALILIRITLLLAQTHNLIRAFLSSADHGYNDTGTEVTIMTKKTLCILLATTVMAGGTACSFAAAGSRTNGISVIYDGEEIVFDVAPVNYNGTVLVPMRAVFEAFGTKVKWDGDTQTVSARKKSRTYTMTVGEAAITETKDDEDTETVTAEQVMQIIDGRTMIPLRALGEILDLDVAWDGDTQTVTLTTPTNADDDAWKDNTGNIDLTGMSADNDGVTVAGKTITVTKGGEYTVTGTNKDGQIVVDTDDKVRLKLSGMELTNTDGAAIYVKNADKCYITVSDGTENTLKDGGTYSETSETNACIYAKDDIEIKGKGTLVINGTVHNGITAKDSLEISNGNITVNSAADGIHVNDTAIISGGNITITAGGDGIQSESILDIKGGETDITCTGEVTASTNSMGFPGANAAEEDDEDEDISSKGLKAEWFMDISGGSVSITSNDTCIKSDSELDISGGTITLTSEVKKGIKGMEDIYIKGGTITILKSTEGIETKRILTINDGDISIVATDDGINAGGNGNDMFGGFGGGMGGRGMTPPEMQNGEMGGMTPPEMQNGEMGGMTPPEMQNGEMGGRPGRRGMTPPEMQNGEMTPPDTENGGMGGRGMRGGMGGMTPPDMENGEMGNMTPPDMQNGNTERGGFGGFGGRAGSTEISTEHHIEINGGYIAINSQGDGIDSNGSLIINGGTIYVNSPTNNGNSAIDHDGLCQVNGGELFAVGSSGMIENPATSSAQNVISAYISASAGDEITIKNAGGAVIISYKAEKTAGHIMYSSDKIKTGETYTVYVNGSEAASGTVESALTTMGTAAGGMGGMGGFGGGRMQRGTQDSTAEKTE